MSQCWRSMASSKSACSGSSTGGGTSCCSSQSAPATDPSRPLQRRCDRRPFPPQRCSRRDRASSPASRCCPPHGMPAGFGRAGDPRVEPLERLHLFAVNCAVAQLRLQNGPIVGRDGEDLDRPLQGRGPERVALFKSSFGPSGSLTTSQQVSTWMPLMASSHVTLRSHSSPLVTTYWSVLREDLHLAIDGRHGAVEAREDCLNPCRRSRSMRSARPMRAAAITACCLLANRDPPATGPSRGCRLPQPR